MTPVGRPTPAPVDPLRRDELVAAGRQYSRSVMRGV